MPRPRAIGRLRQERLASREHMRALLHSLDLLNLELSPLPVSYRAPDAEKHETREMHGNRAFIFNHESGLAEWVCSPDLESGADWGVRVTLHPDEGGPLFCAWQFLASLDLPVGFCRDETPLSSAGTHRGKSCNFCRWLEPHEKWGLRHKLQTHFLRFLNATPGVRRVPIASGVNFQFKQNLEIYIEACRC